jgi:hypothetical protein
VPFRGVLGTVSPRTGTPIVTSIVTSIGVPQMPAGAAAASELAANFQKFQRSKLQKRQRIG